MVAPERLPDPLKRFVLLFNDEEFWESHEVLEDPWREEGSEFFHGLILYASAFVHARRGNPHGIDAQLRKAEEALEAYRPYYLGINVGHLLSHANRCHGLVADHEGLDSGGWAELIPFPKLVLRKEYVRGDEPELDRR